MPFNDLLNSNSICIDTTARSKTAVLLKVSQLLQQNHPHIEVETLFDVFWKRESLGSTSIGRGILIPHVRMDGVQRAHGCVIKLQYPVDFGAEDKQPIDLVFGLLVAVHQVDEHLQTLAKILKHFDNQQFRRACQRVAQHEELCSLFMNQTQQSTMAML